MLASSPNRKAINIVLFLVLFVCLCLYVNYQSSASSDYDSSSSSSSSSSASRLHDSRTEIIHQRKMKQNEDDELVDLSRVKFPVSLPGKYKPHFECKVPENPTFYSQIDQDKLIYEEFFKDPLVCGGVVLDIGANEGIRMSNSLFFEESLGWKSYCVEASPEIYETLRKNRPGCHNLNAAVSNRTSIAKYVKGEMLGGLVETVDYTRVLNIVYKGDAEAFKKGIIDIQTLPPTSIIKMFNIPVIDVLSIDVEGAELGVVKAFEFDKVYIKVLTIEANRRDTEKNEKVRAYLESQGFIMHKKWEWEEIYLSHRFALERGLIQE